MLIKHPPKIKPSEITPSALARDRRRFLAALAVSPALSFAPSLAAADDAASPVLLAASPSDYRVDAPPTPKEKAQTYNNFYELGSQKNEPAENADLYQSRPWRLAIEGECAKPGVFELDDLLSLAPLEDRIYRLRCVEAWSMVIPWIGYPLSKLLAKVEPNSNAKFVQFLTFNPETLFPDDANRSLPWPYSEGLRIDEAMHPLSLLTFGMYGEALPNQNGAPVRMVVPWKYGFKSAKALVSIRLVADMPPTAWNDAQAREYGFYSNVNPERSHPRWSQATEKAIGDSYFPDRRETEKFNGYGEEVAGLYAGMDLQQQF